MLYPYFAEFLEGNSISISRSHVIGVELKEPKTSNPTMSSLKGQIRPYVNADIIIASVVLKSENLHVVQSVHLLQTWPKLLFAKPSSSDGSLVTLSSV